jgi:hypothetical protein
LQIAKSRHAEAIRMPTRFADRLINSLEAGLDTGSEIIPIRCTALLIADI